MELEPHVELKIRKMLDAHKQDANSRYAIKMVERIVFYMMGALGIGVLGAILKLVII